MRDNLYALITVALLWASPAHSQGFAGLGADGDGYARVTPGHEITFPADHGAHPDYRIEWWYLTANLTDKTGAALGVQWTLFRQAADPAPQREGWASQQFWMGHTALTTADRHLHAESLARGGTGQAGVTSSPFAAWIDASSLTSIEDGFAPLRLQSAGDDFSYDLTLTTDAPMVLQGEGGYSRKSDRGQASYYVSQPFFDVTGTVTIDGQPRTATGRAWMDREWSSQPLAEDQEGWDWFSMHLGTGEKVMLFRLRHADGRHYFAGNWITPNGTSTPLPSEGITMTPLTETTVANRRIPTRWELSIPTRALTVTTDALNPQSWNGTLFPYWEGPITVTGTHDGMGYLEMTGYAPKE